LILYVQQLVYWLCKVLSYLYIQRIVTKCPSSLSSMVWYHVYKSPPLVLHETTPQHQNWRIYFNILSSETLFHVWHSSQVCLPKACMHLSAPCILHVHDLINFLIFYEGYKSWSSRLCCFLQPSIISSSLEPIYSW
jgi:hypothetical protein